MVTEKLEHHHKHEMQGWFKRIKAHCEDKIDRHDPQTAKKFSEFCHYEGIFALSTLYYTSVFFLYSQQIRSLAPFSELDPCFGAKLEGLLQQVGDAFARKGINEERGGLWPPVQDNMGATVKKGDWYQSYPEFCRIFIEETPTCEYHVFFRALDFFGAFDGAFDKPSCALLDTEGATAIVTALEALLRFLPTNEAGGRGMCAASLDAFVG
jgi:hypothetical protein